VFWQLIADAQDSGQLGDPLVKDLEPAALPLLQDDAPVAGLSPERQAAAWAAISLLLGAIAVEVFKHMPPCDETTGMAVFHSKVRVALCIVGLPEPR
jgi:hypothetical protein